MQSHFSTAVTMFSVNHETIFYVKCNLILTFKDVVTKVLSATYFNMWRNIYYICFDDSKQMN